MSIGPLETAVQIRKGGMVMCYIGGMTARYPVSLNLSAEEFEQLEELRGDVPRGTFIKGCLFNGRWQAGGGQPPAPASGTTRESKSRREGSTPSWGASFEQPVSPREIEHVHVYAWDPVRGETRCGICGEPE